MKKLLCESIVYHNTVIFFFFFFFIKNVYRLLIDIVGVLIDTKAFVCLFVCNMTIVFPINIPTYYYN